MKKLDEREIAQSYAGKPYDTEKLLDVPFENGDNRYIAYCHNFKKELLDLFGITPTILEKWESCDVELSVFINTDGTEIKNCGLDKCKYSCPGHGRPRVKVLKPTQQEIRIFRRIMNFVTTIED